MSRARKVAGSRVWIVGRILKPRLLDMGLNLIIESGGSSVHLATGEEGVGQPASHLTHWVSPTLSLSLAHARGWRDPHARF